jgi:hypothetical protein
MGRCAAACATIAWIDSIRVRCAVFALDSHNLCANAARAGHHEDQRRDAGHQRARQNRTMIGLHNGCPAPPPPVRAV